MSSESIRKSTRKRPFGVSVIILVLILYILALILVFGVTLGIEIKLGDSAIDRLDLEDNRILNTLLIYGLLPAFIVLEMAIAFGLWRLQRWAWVLLMVQVGLSMIGDLWSYLQGNPSYFTMLMDIVLVFYLNQREVQSIFEYEKESRWAPRAI
ncbi:MAG: hypothetical protein HPY61_10385 [Methanotrichaceae archaeon]|nr:hypothetical protein [Methanotrichaceae archaeon]